MIEREIEADANGTRLAGTLCLPAGAAAVGQFPAVLMVHGSGDVFNTIAHGLARSGVASLRYDKRGGGASQGDELAAKTGLSGLVIKLATALMARPVENQRKLIQKLKATSQPSLRVGLQRLPAKCSRDLLNADAAQAYAATRCPVLLVGGEKDLQCDPADLARVAALVTGPVESHVVKN